MRNIYLLTFSFLLFVNKNLYAQNAFLRIYPGTPGTQGFYCGSIPTCLEKTNDSGFLIGGYTCQPDTPGFQKMQLRKIDSQGNIIWDMIDRVTTYDEIDDVVAYDDTTIFCAVRLLGSHGGIVKRNKQGKIVWAKDLFNIVDTCTGINSLIKTKDGNLVFTGAYYNCSGADVAIIIAKIDTAGNYLWKKIVHRPYSSSGLDIVETIDSNYLVTGFTSYTDTILHLEAAQTFLAKYSADGNEIFLKVYGNIQLGFSGRSVAVLPNTNIALAGEGIYSPWSQSDGALIITDDTGRLISYFIDTITNPNLYWRIKAKGNYAYLLESSSEFHTSDTSADFRIQRYSSVTGSIDFSKSYTLLGSQGYPYDMEVLSNGSMAISFYEQDSVCPGCTGFVVLDSTGCVPDWCATFIKEVETGNISVFPNPFYQSFTISGFYQADVILLDFMGNIVFSRKNVNNDTFYFSNQLPSGIYFLQIKQESKLHTFKLIHVN